jgi:hypothetical protein
MLPVTRLHCVNVKTLLLTVLTVVAVLQEAQLSCNGAEVVYLYKAAMTM